MANSLTFITNSIEAANTVAGLEKEGIEQIEESQNEPIQEPIIPLVSTENGSCLDIVLYLFT